MQALLDTWVTRVREPEGHVAGAELVGLPVLIEAPGRNVAVIGDTVDAANEEVLRRPARARLARRASRRPGGRRDRLGSLSACPSRTASRRRPLMPPHGQAALLFAAVLHGLAEMPSLRDAVRVAEAQLPPDARRSDHRGVHQSP